MINNNRELESIDLLFNKLFNDNYFINSDTLNTYSSSDEHNYYIKFSLPGVEKKDINLNFNDHYIYLNYDAAENSDNLFLNRSFNQRIKLPNDIDINKIIAELKNGILSIVIPKDKKQCQNKKITIK